ncbi:ricin-type beta-trefoil lectin domain protein [Streptomyces sp. NPDC006193]|uniref:ricin-type beta-trefoil lectin domain protein n=1 Tax=Streptomyces sp. NPDC006193 TaxID=3155717 RepID=UPI0033ACFC6B
MREAGPSDEQLSAELKKWTGTAPALHPVGELLDRHWAAAFAYARLCTDGPRAAGMLTTAAFTRLFGAALRQAGPAAAWRPHVLVAVRRLAAEWDADDRRELLHPALRSGGGAGERAAARLLPPPGRRLLTRAFQRAPETSRAVLWHCEVEAEPLSVPAALLGLDEEGARVELSRARARLREECLQAHRELAPEDECRRYLRMLDVTFRRGGAAVDPDLREHLGRCAHCSRTGEQLDRFNGGLGLALAEAVLGWGARGYVESRARGAEEPAEPAPAAAAVAPVGGEAFTPADPHPPAGARGPAVAPDTAGWSDFAVSTGWTGSAAPAEGADAAGTALGVGAAGAAGAGWAGSAAIAKSGGSTGSAGSAGGGFGAASGAASAGPGEQAGAGRPARRAASTGRRRAAGRGASAARSRSGEPAPDAPAAPGGTGRSALRAARRARRRNLALAVLTVSGLVVVPLVLWSAHGSGDPREPGAAGAPTRTAGPGGDTRSPGGSWTGGNRAGHSALRGRLHNLASGLCVGVTGKKAVEGAETELAACSAAPTQQWTYETDGLLRNAAAPGLCLDSRLGYSVRLAPCAATGEAARTLRYDFTPQGALVPRGNPELALTPAATDGSGALVLKTRAPGAAQRWSVDTAHPDLRMENVNWSGGDTPLAASDAPPAAKSRPAAAPPTAAGRCAAHAQPCDRDDGGSGHGGRRRR